MRINTLKTILIASFYFIFCLCLEQTKCMEENKEENKRFYANFRDIEVVSNNNEKFLFGVGCDLLNEKVFENELNSVFYLEMIYDKSQRDGKKRTYCGSAARIGKNILITAAHNLYDKEDGGFPDRIDCFMACYENSVLFEHTIKNIENEVNIFVPKNYINNSDKNNDIALILIDNHENNTNYNGGSIAIPCILEEKVNDKEITITGYPGKRIAHRSKGKILEYKEDGTVTYKVSTQPGQSGSGLYFYEEGKITCYGVHTSAGDPGDYYNIGVLINKEILDIITKMDQK